MPSGTMCCEHEHELLHRHVCRFVLTALLHTIPTLLECGTAATAATACSRCNRLDMESHATWQGPHRLAVLANEDEASLQVLVSSKVSD